MLDSINASIKKLQGGLPVEGKTTGDLPGFGKIKDIATVDNLIKAHSSVVMKAKAYRDSAKEIIPEGIKPPSFVLNGSSESAWVDDIKARVNVVAHKAKLAKLNSIKNTLESHLSEEMKLAKDLAAISEMVLDDTI